MPYVASTARRSSVASAPGKCILFGEHSVVYGYPAVAAALSDLRIFVHVALHTEGSFVEAVLSDLPSEGSKGGPVSARVAFEDIRGALVACGLPAPWWKPSPPSPAQIGALTSLLDALPEFDRAALVPLLFLCAALLPQLLDESSTSAQTGVRIHVKSADLPVGAGLGSSAAFSVSLAAALLQLQMEALGEPLSSGAEEAATRRELAADKEAAAAAPVEDPTAAAGAIGGSLSSSKRCCLKPGAACRALIDKWAYAAECILHGKPSGLDNAVACAGDAMRLSKSDAKAGLVFEPIASFPRLRILLTNTRVPRKTSALVGRVKALHEAHPAITTPIFEAMAAVAEQFLELCSSENSATSSSTSSSTSSTIGLLVRINHRLLGALQVSAPALEDVANIAQAAEFGLPTKLTGAGGGGCAFSVLGGESIDEETLRRAHACRKTLEAKGYTCYLTAVGGHGALWHEGVDEAAFLQQSAAAAGRLRQTTWLMRAAAAAAVAIGVAAATVARRRAA